MEKDTSKTGYNESYGEYANGNNPHDVWRDVFKEIAGAGDNDSIELGLEEIIMALCQARVPVSMDFVHNTHVYYARCQADVCIKCGEDHHNDWCDYDKDAKPEILQAYLKREGK